MSNYFDSDYVVLYGMALIKKLVFNSLVWQETKAVKVKLLGSDFIVVKEIVFQKIYIWYYLLFKC